MKYKVTSTLQSLIYQFEPMNSDDSSILLEVHLNDNLDKIVSEASVIKLIVHSDILGWCNLSGPKKENSIQYNLY